MIYKWLDFISLFESKNPEQIVTSSKKIKAKNGDYIDLELAQKIFSYDISDNKKYVSWLINFIFKNSESESDFINKLDDINIKELLSNYSSLKNHIPEKDKNINNFKTLDSLKEFISNYEDILSQKSKRKQKGESISKEEYIKIYEDSDWNIIIPLTKAASIYWGSGTKWCTASGGEDNYFDVYNKVSPLFIFRNNYLSQPDNNGQRWREKSYQLYFGNIETSTAPEFKNGLNLDAQPSEFFESNPKIKDIFFTWLSENNSLVLSLCSSNPIESLQKSLGYVAFQLINYDFFKYTSPNIKKSFDFENLAIVTIRERDSITFSKMLPLFSNDEKLNLLYDVIHKADDRYEIEEGGESEMKYLEMIKSLVESGCDPTKKSILYQVYPIEYLFLKNDIVFEESINIIKYLLSKGCKFHFQNTNSDYDNNYRLRLVNRISKFIKEIFDYGGFEFLEYVDVIKKLGFNIFYDFDVNGDNSTTYLTRENNTSMLNYILHEGANPNIPNSNGEYALHISSSNVIDIDIEITESLLNYDANPNIKDKDGNTPLILCTKSYVNRKSTEDMHALLDVLISNGADATIRNNEGKDMNYYLKIDPTSLIK